ncbi:hypothetical protein OG271_13920 [Micromonospora rifamycinica]|nr:hypothetical protein [Micromonospora rifamycinica]
MPHLTVLDVRRDLERAGARIDGALHIPLHDLLHHLDQAHANGLLTLAAN